MKSYDFFFISITLTIIYFLVIKLFLYLFIVGTFYSRFKTLIINAIEALNKTKHYSQINFVLVSYIIKY